jgi:uncharacterized membrane protein
LPSNEKIFNVLFRILSKPIPKEKEKEKEKEKGKREKKNVFRSMKEAWISQAIFIPTRLAYVLFGLRSVSIKILDTCTSNRRMRHPFRFRSAEIGRL